MHSDAFLELYHRNLGLAVEQQAALHNFVSSETEETETRLDEESMQLVVGDLRMNVVVVGRNDADGKWIWVWNDTAAERFCSDESRQLKQTGAELGISEFESAEPQDHVFEAFNMFGVVAGAVGKAQATFCIRHEEQAWTVLIHDERIKIVPGDPLLHIVQNIPRMLSNCPMYDHPAVLCSYLDVLQVPYDADASSCKTRIPDRPQQLFVEFDEKSRIKSVQVD